MDEQKTITISLDEYKAALRIKERIAVLARLIENVEYINTGEVVAVLDIDIPRKEQK